MKKPVIQKAIRLEKFVIRELKYSAPFEQDDSKLEMKLDKKIEALPNSPRFYCVKFHFALSNSEKTLDIEIKAEAKFEANQDVNEKFLGTDIVQINSAAIAFPLLRSFVNTLTVNAGAAQIILPIVNFSRQALESKD